ncbi:MAG TPA: 30S ribosomal protein S6--L-glutamate ligase, partial [Flavobacteriales bacterium]|nr:30S ribosomal protein S6--L-glutamate ligase [Flavobacteriales bacterium]
MNIVVLSRDTKLYSTKRLVEAIEARGHSARVVNHVKCDILI